MTPQELKHTLDIAHASAETGGFWLHVTLRSGRVVVGAAFEFEVGEPLHLEPVTGPQNDLFVSVEEIESITVESI